MGKQIAVSLTVSLTLGRLITANHWRINTWKWSQRPGLNRRPLLYESIALPLSYAGLKGILLCQPRPAASRRNTRRRCNSPLQNGVWSGTLAASAVILTVNQKNFFAAALGTALCLSVQNISAAGTSAPPVRLSETAGTFVLDNGILRAEIEKHNGVLYSLEFHGKELLAGGGGYWSSVGRGLGNRTPGTVAAVVARSAERAEISCRLGNVAGATNISLDTDYRYSLARGDSTIYVAAVLHHTPGTPGYGTGESRYCLKLNPDVFNFLSVDAGRQRLMPTGYDWDHGTQMNVKEARRLNTGVHKGEVEHKYDYSAMFSDIPAYGWSGTKSKIGLWLINPSLEFIGGGPTKVELTGHLDVNPGGTPTLLNMWQGSHYGGTSLAVGPDEDWTKVVGPFAIYCNTGTTPNALWQNALVQATNEMRQWPYAWFRDKNFPSAAQRGTVSGKILLQDAFDADAKWSNVWVGVSAPDYRPPRTGGPSRRGGTNAPPPVDWQRDTKFYQFWTRADADGNFEIKNVRPGNYTLHAFGDGALGEFTLTNLTVGTAEKKLLGELAWQPPRFGRTLWQIGVADRTAREFRHGDHYWQWGLYYDYSKEFPHDVNFIIGQSDWRRDWNYAQPPRITGGNHPVVSEDEEGDNTSAAPATRSRGIEMSTWKIQFNLTNAPAGKATLRLSFAGARDGSAVAVDVNHHDIGDTGPLPATGVMHRDGIRGYWFERDLTFDAKLLHTGTNQIELTSFANNWTQGVLYDCVRLELDAAK
jgi:rhamnogalacturonan endolyase